MERSDNIVNDSSSTQSKKNGREKTDLHITSIYGVPSPTNSNTASRLAQIDDMKYFFATATQQWNHNNALKRFDLIDGESISCVLWDGLFFITGTDILRSLTFRFHAFGRPVVNAKKFEEGVFSDLRNLKPGKDARLENPKSELLEMLYKNNCIRTQKKQKVFFWFSVPHDRLFLDALERDLKREKMGQEPTTKAISRPATSVSLETAQVLFNQLKKKTDHSLGVTLPKPSLFNSKNDSFEQKRPRVNSVSSILGHKQRQSYGSYFSTSPLSTSRIRTNASTSIPNNTVPLSGISKPSLSSPLYSSDYTDISRGVHQLDITSSLSNTSSTSSGILQRNVLPSQSFDGKTIFGNLGIFDGASLYKSRRRRSSSSVSPSQYGFRRHDKSSTMRPGAAINGSRLAMAAAKAGFTAPAFHFHCPVPDCQHYLVQRSDPFEHDMRPHSMHSDNVLSHHQSPTNGSTSSPIFDVKMSFKEQQQQQPFKKKSMEDDISSSSASSPRSYQEHQTMKLFDSFKPEEYELETMNDISFDHQSQDSLNTVIIEGKTLKTKVVILGAGASGISAAKTLSNENIHDFLLVDAQPFVGGRVQHASFGGSIVELGANWIYGKGQNPIYKLALSHGLLTTPNDKNNVMYFDDNGLISDQEFCKNTSNEFAEIQIKLVDYAEQRLKRQQVDLSSRSALSLIDWRPDTPLKAAVEYFNIDWEFSEPAEMCSLDYATGTIDTVTGTYPFGNEFVIDQRGFNHILKEETKSFLDLNDKRLLLNTFVTKIAYNDQNVTIFTANGDTIEAEYAICTFSLGVLQSDTVEFKPRLPEWKRESLLSFHMTTYTKIFLKFNKRFWDDWQFALYANNVTHNGGYYTVWQNLNAPGYFFQSIDNILMVTTTDKESHRIESMTDTQVKQEIIEVLGRMFPSMEPPTDILIPRWHQHPLFRGSYSNWPIGALTKHHANMRAPLMNRLWFAGEAMSAEYYGYLHGAWFEGQSVADSVSHCILHSCPYYEKYKYVTACDQQPTRPKFFKQF